MSAVQEDFPDDGFRPQIDSLRALAVIAVMVFHLWPTLFSLGHEGVRLFFVISGYLITRILIASRPAPHAGGGLRVLRSFYVRRFLRLFPAYYMALLILFLGASSVGTSIWYHLSYTSNLWFGRTGGWSPWFTAHFWSLSVEEQFYLFWPIVILLMPPRRLWMAAAVLFVAGPASRILLFHLGVNDVMLWVATPASFDALGGGALLACVENLARTRRIVSWFAVIAAVGLILIKLTYLSWQTVNPVTAYWVFYVVEEMLDVALFIALVHYASRGMTGWAGVFLGWRALRFLGRISYGLYLYHPLVWWAVIEVFRLPMPVRGPVALFVIGSLTVGVATLSWKVMETPVNRLKRYFPYTSGKPSINHAEHF